MKTIFLALLLVLGGCATTKEPSGRFSQLQLGMTEAEVLELIGKPDSLSVDSKFKVLEYKVGIERKVIPPNPAESLDSPKTFSDASSRLFNSIDYDRKMKYEWVWHYVRLKDGKVESFGRSLNSKE